MRMISMALPAGALWSCRSLRRKIGRRARVRAYRSPSSAQGSYAKKSTKMRLLVSLKVTRRLNERRCR
jgi:hypothetical protein